MEGSTSRRICKVCVRAVAGYTCPRCNTAYCSLPCYKTHSLNCTEAFYRDQASAELHGLHADDGQKWRMMGILQRMHEQDAAEEAVNPLHVRGLNSDSGSDSGCDTDSGSSNGSESQEGMQASSSSHGNSSRSRNGGRTVALGPGHGIASGGGGGRGQHGPSPSAAASAVADAVAASLSHETMEKLLLKAQSQGADAFDICEADVPPDEWRAFSAALDHAHAQPQPPGASRLHAPPAASALASTATAAGAAAAAEAGASAASSGSMESYRGCRQSSSSPDAGALQQHGVQRRPMDQQSGHSPWWLHADARSIRLGPHGQAVVVVVGEGQQQRQQQIASQHGPPPDVTKVGINCDAMVGGDGAGANDRDDDSMDVPAPHAAVLPSPPAEPLPPLHSLSCAPPSPLLAWHLVELLYAYCFTARIFDGVLHDYNTPRGDTLSSSSGKGGSTTSSTAICSTAAGGSVGSSGSQNRHHDSMLPRGCTAQDAVAHMEVLTGLLLPPAPAATARACATATLASATASQQQQHAGTHAGPQSAADAVLNVLTAACKPPLGDARSRTAAVAVLHDVLTVLSTGRGGVLLALTDMRCSVLQAADAVVQADVSSAQSVSTASTKSSYKIPYFGKAARMRLTAADRKLLYFSAWANELVPEQYDATAAAVQVQYTMHAGAVGMEAEPMHAPASAASMQGHRVAVLDVGVLGDVSGGLRAAQRLLDPRGHQHGGDVHT